MKGLIGSLLAAIGGGTHAGPHRRPGMRAAGRATLDSSIPTPTDPIDEAMETRMQEQAEVQGTALRQLEQALQQRLDRLEVAVGAKLQAQLITLARLIGETAAAVAAPPAPPEVRPAGPVPRPPGVAGTPADARHIDAGHIDGDGGSREGGR